MNGYIENQLDREQSHENDSCYNSQITIKEDVKLFEWLKKLQI